ncbi:Uma2 family endonuclease [Nocardiopsis potens]|uniref:Uma2 family endonuclease n=1 Tax=Nocardiopsis potens TaxID=1246458 RepID=UPI00034D7BF2|nr:Uma2 family endonuclease [Nocardiopsis potens]
MGISVIEEQAAAERTGAEWDFLLRTWKEMDVPDGWRAEIREEGIVLLPPPAPRHNSNEFKIVRQLLPRLPEGWEIHHGTGVVIPSALRLRAPDLMVLPESAVPEGRGEPVAPDDVELVVEIVSKGNASDDRRAKRADYASAAVPLYLLVDGYDPNGPRVSLLSRPEGRDYLDVHSAPWGRPITLPEPFGFDLDTSGFLVPKG